MKYQYKNSGIEWMGEIPEHWKVDRIKDICENVVGGGTPKSSIPEYWDDGEIIWVSPTDFSKHKGERLITDSEKKITQLGMEKSSATLIPEGTVVMSSRASIGEPKIAGKEITTNQGFISFISGHKIDNLFLFYCIEGQLGEYFSNIASGTTFMEISRRMAKQEPIPLPPLPEQKAIASYLDKACARIDRIIAIKKEQLKKIDGYFHTKLHETITQGIGKSEYKAGNNFYMGKVPKGWKVDRIKDVCEFNPVKSKARCLPNETVSLFPMENVSDDGKILGRDEMLYSEVDSGLNYFENGDVIFAKITPCMENGKGAFIEDVPTKVSFGSTEFFVLRPNFRLLGKFIYYATRNYKFRAYLEANMKGAAGQQRVTSKFFQFCEIAFPKDRVEQQLIIDYLDELKIKTDNLLNKTKQQINTLRTYRKSLIHECVTGKKQIADIIETEKELKTT